MSGRSQGFLMNRAPKGVPELWKPRRAEQAVPPKSDRVVGNLLTDRGNVVELVKAR